MPAPTKKTPQRLSKMVAMHKAGASAREISDELGLDSKTILGWLTAAGLEANGGLGPRAKRKREPGKAETKAVAELAAEQLAAADSPLPTDRTGAIAVVQERLRVVRSLLKRLDGPVESGEYPAPAYVQLVKLESDLAARIAELTPPAPADPETDPTNQDAATAARVRLERLVDRAEATVTCRHCGKHPFSAARRAA
jgi:transposase